MSKAEERKKIAVIAVGGNSLIRDSSHQSVEDQYQAICATVENILPLIENGYEIVLTHGNGPQVGFILRRSELSAHELHAVPLDSCVADTQGAIGYQFQKAFLNAFRKKGINKKVVTLVTQVLVDKNDSSFIKPTKPIGSFMTQEKAKEMQREKGWNIMEDAGRGYRRVVASPRPIEIIEIESVRQLVDKGFVVITIGGGGIPVIRLENGDISGIAAVIDKDLASSLLAKELKSDIFVVSTGVEKVYLDYGKPSQKALDHIDLNQLRGYTAQGHFKPGSMLPKIEAATEYLEGGGKKAIITDPDNLGKAILGQTGTHIIP